jgi:hypothetical protein
MLRRRCWMATPALSSGVMFVRTSQSLFAIGRK